MDPRLLVCDLNYDNAPLLFCLRIFPHLRDLVGITIKYMYLIRLKHSALFTN